MTLLKVLNKKRNITYVYESQSKWDSEKNSQNQLGSSSAKLIRRPASKRQSDRP